MRSSTSPERPCTSKAPLGAKYHAIGLTTSTLRATDFVPPSESLQRRVVGTLEVLCTEVRVSFLCSCIGTILAGAKSVPEALGLPAKRSIRFLHPFTAGSGTSRRLPR
jgi:hypothetical protein